MDYSKLNVQKIEKKSINKMGSTGKFVNLHYTGEGSTSVKIKLPYIKVLKKPYSFEGDTSKMYFLLTLVDNENEESLVKFFNDVDNWMITLLADYSYEWFGVKLHFNEVKKLYKKSFFKKDKEINLRLKLPFRYGKCTCSFTGEGSEPKTIDFIEENKEYYYIIELNGIWYTHSGIGITWNCTNVDLVR